MAAHAVSKRLGHANVTMAAKYLNVDGTSYTS